MDPPLVNVPSGNVPLEETGPEYRLAIYATKRMESENGIYYMDSEIPADRMTFTNTYTRSTSGGGGGSTGAAITANKTDAQGKALAGATFVLEDSRGREAYQATSNTSGTVRFTDVSSGTYTLLEKKAPEGYVLSNETYTLTVSGSRVTMNGKAYLEGVILYSHNSNAYWPEGSEYDDDQPPLCQSFDGKVGYGEPGGTCADCVLNQFGSDGNNKGKACKNMRMLYLLRSGEYMPIQIALPPTSLTPYTRFVNEAFLSRRRKVCTGVVRIGLKKAVSGSHEYCVATFTKIADFAGEDLAHIRAYADGFVAQIKDINAQRAQAGAAASSIIGDGDASHLELPDNGAHFALGAVIDGEREELPA